MTALQTSDYIESANPTVQAVEKAIRKLSSSDVPMLLLAEAGAGKRATARRIHETSGARQFLVTRCSDLTPEDFRPEKDTLLACKGTVYLEEIADLNPACQASLLQALDHLESPGNGKSHAHLVFGSKRDLESAVRADQFNEELYRRISAVCLRLPPLRHRRQDIEPLTNCLLAKSAKDLGRAAPGLSAETRQLFLEYDWPGNIRELTDAAKAIVVIGDESLAMGGLRAMFSRTDRAHDDGGISLREAARAASREAEKELILRALTRTRWNRKRAAQELHISYKALLYKLKQMNERGAEAS
jgi:two-component system, NtrC family, response regulator AtoC